MAKFIGRRVNVGIGKETSRGVGVASSQTIPKINYTFDDKANKARAGEGLGNISGGGSQAIVVSRFSEGSIDGEIDVNSFGLILLATFGTESVAAYQTTAYTHTYTLANTNQHTTLSIHCDDPIQDKIFKGCMVDSLEFEINQSDVVKFTCGLKGRKGNDDNFSPSYAVDYKFVGRDLILKVASDTSGLAAASALSVKELKITINKNTDFDNVLGTLEPEDVLNKQFTIQGSLTLNYEDETWKNYMTGGTKRAIGIKLTNTRDTIGSAGNPEFYLELPIVDFSEWESQRGNDDIAGQTINFTALYDIANSRLISSCYLNNTSAAY